MSFLQTSLIVLAASSVAIADIFLKKTENLGSIGKALTSPWMLAALALYLFQIVFFTYAFISGFKLINVGVMQVALYSIIILLASFFLFNETLSQIQIFGVFIALVGILFMHM